MSYNTYAKANLIKKSLNLHFETKIMEIKITSESEIGRGARELLEAIGDRCHVALRGGMGAGKTTLTSAVCAALGVEDDVTSPTFSIINEYRDRDGEAIYHFDFYRIENEAQGQDLGLDEYFDSGSLCLMEWPENIGGLLPDDTVDVQIEVGDDGERTIIINN